MSNYGSYPSSPQEPWSGQQPPPGAGAYGPPQGPYGQPTDPWGGQEPWGGEPTSVPPGGPGSPSGYGAPGPPGSPSGYGAGRPSTQPYEPGYAPAAAAAPVWSQPGPPPAPPRRRGNGPLIALVVVLALLVVAGGVAALVKLGGLGEGDPQATTTSAPATPATDPPTPADTASPAGPDAGVDARFVKKGQCVVNQGSERDPTLKVVGCGAKTLEVIARYDGTTDYEGKCKSLPEYDFHYYYDSQLDTLDFVLCLKQR